MLLFHPKTMISVPDVLPLVKQSIESPNSFLSTLLNSATQVQKNKLRMSLPQMFSKLIFPQKTAGAASDWTLMSRESYMIDLLVAVEVFVPSEGSFRLAAMPEADESIGKRRAGQNGAKYIVSNQVQLCVGCCSCARASGLVVVTCRRFD